MTPKEKANYLVEEFTDKFFDLRDGYNSVEIYKVAKQCALIAVDEIIKEYNEMEAYKFILEIDYWKEVKQEIEKL